MMAIIDSLASFFLWLLLTSLKAIVVVTLIIIVQTIFRNKLSARWQHALWLLLIVRLIIPFEMSSSASVFNLTGKMQYQNIPKKIDDMDGVKPQNSSSATLAASVRTINIVKQSQTDNKISLSRWQIIGITWLAVVIIIFIYTIVANTLLWLKIRNTKLIDDIRLYQILDKCKKRLNVKIDVRINSIDGFNTPFWYGLFSPIILFPKQLLHSLGDDELEHIFMHELAHHKQGDLPLAFLTTVLQILHWFNPVIWLAFFKMRADRENACDELALARLGEDQSKKYGTTIISLIDIASHRRFMPVAVGLADTKFNLKRRIAMIANYSKKSIWWTVVSVMLISTLALFALTGATENTNISGTVSLQQANKPDSIYVGVYRIIPHDWPVIDYVGEPYQLSTSTKANFSFQVKPGMYTIAAWAYGYERAFAEIIVRDEESKLRIDFSLVPKSLPGKVTQVKLIGDFCNWNKNNAIEMARTGDAWNVNGASYLKEGQAYKFIVSGTKQNESSNISNVEYFSDLYRYFSGNQNVIPVKDYATFNNIYKGGEITFDPALYKTFYGNAQITVSGFDLYDQFTQVQDSLRKFEIYYHKIRSENRYTTTDERRKAYAILTERFEKLEKRYDPYFAPIFHEYWLGNLLGMHPTRVDFASLWDNEAPDSLTLEKFLEESEFVNYFRQLVDHLQDLKPDMILIDGHLWEGLRFIRMHVPFFPTLRQKLNIDENFEYNYIVNFCEKTKNDEAKTELLYHMADTYASEDPYEPDKAKYLIEWLYRDLPDNWYIKEGHAEKIINKFSLKKGDLAPGFSVKSLNGENIQLVDYRSRFVFLEFWGSNCGPCIAETPNMIKLSESIPQDSLIIIGMANAELKDAQDYIKDSGIQYPNALLTNNIQNAYGITYYPSTFLIDPDGKIIGKDLRGTTLVKQIREKMMVFGGI